MTVRLISGDCREVLRTLPDKSVHCCVTSPPYFGLRDYGTASWDGGDPDCEHKPKANKRVTRAASGLQGGMATVDAGNVQRDCHCGARRIDRQMGLEPTPDEFVAGMVEVFREVRRVLRDDGTLWLNIGDSYANKGCDNTSVGGFTGARIRAGKKGGMDSRPREIPQGCKPKDLIGIPWLLAFALRADGWYLRQDIIWSKPNPMPESVRDRCTKAHEYLFLLSKSPKYHFDADAIAETMTATSVARLSQNVEAQPGSDRVPGKTNGPMKAVKPRPSGTQHRQLALGRQPTGLGSNDPFERRNKRSVWEVTTQPFSEAHFATFPPALIEPCILAGCPVGGTVLDPFGGAGTTGLVADRLQRSAILIELNPEYAAIAERRLHADAGMFAEIAA